jgi:hypothetical protein
MRSSSIASQIGAHDPKSPFNLSLPGVMGTLNGITVTIIGYLHSPVENRLCFFQNILD